MRRFTAVVGSALWMIIASSWSVVPSPNPTRRTAILSGVSCVASSGTCMAVGSYATRGGSKTLVERWDGASWTIVPSPNPAKASSSSLQGVSCSSDSAS